MMGSSDTPQKPFFYAFNLDDAVPQDHLLRSIDRFLDLSDLRQHLEPYYSHTGRPSVDPELMIRMLLIGYCLGIRSERRLCEEVKLNMAYRWFCRLSIEDKVPDHSTFSKNRHGRFREAEAFRFVFEQVLERCINAGLVSGEGFAVDASVVKADASRQRHHEDDDDWGGWSRIKALSRMCRFLKGESVAMAPSVAQTLISMKKRIITLVRMANNSSGSDVGSVSREVGSPKPTRSTIVPVSTTAKHVH